MEKVRVSDELFIGCPEGFHVMSEEELKGMNFMAEGPGIAMKDPDRHILVSVGVQKMNGFSALMLNQKELVKNMEKRIEQAQKPYGYHGAEFLTRQAGPDKADGVGYEYTAQDVGMYSESFAVKKGKNVTYYHLYARSANKEESLKIWEEILGSVEVK